MSEMPALPDSCWPVDVEACDELSTYTEPQREMASALAAQTMRALTGYAVGGCPGTFRPCPVRCVAGSPNWHWVNGTFTPVNLSGTWVNMTCGCGWDCSHGVEQVRLPGYVTSIVEVKVDGEVIPDTDYRVDNGNLLVRTDGLAWPSDQQMALPDTEEGTFSVTYSTGIPVDGLGAFCAGLLACEYAKAMAGKACALPKSVTNIVRQGVSMQITPGAFPKGLTGVPTIDAYLLRWNPHQLKMAPAIWSPDVDGGRVTTWVAP